MNGTIELNGVEITVYHHEGHTWNVDRMIESVSNPRSNFLRESDSENASCDADGPCTRPHQQAHSHESTSERFPPHWCAGTQDIDAADHDAEEHRNNGRQLTKESQ